MKYRIQHKTQYSYSQALSHGVHELRLTPPNMAWQSVTSWQIKVPSALTTVKDGFGNQVSTFTVQGNVERPLLSMCIEALGEVEVLAHGECFIEEVPQGGVLVSPLYYLGTTPLTTLSTEMRDFAQLFLGTLTINSNEEHVLTQALALSKAIIEKVTYTSSSTDVGTSAQESFVLGAGVCQDHAHIMLACCRAFGLPARYVSGYLFDADAPYLASHAWVDVCVDVAMQRWTSIDVTHHCITDTHYVRLAVGRDYQGAAPIRGVRQGGGDESMDVQITITPLG